jgi:hypothetical protein
MLLNIIHENSRLYPRSGWQKLQGKGYGFRAGGADQPPSGATFICSYNTPEFNAYAPLSWGQTSESPTIAYK